MTKKPDQLGYPAVVLLIDRQDNRSYKAVAIDPTEGCDLDRDVAPCCYLGQHGRPRYRVDGIERGDFDPTIPPAERKAAPAQPKADQVVVVVKQPAGNPVAEQLALF